MGQRTQTIIRVTDKTNDTTTLKVYHDQWGIGRILPIKLMSGLCMYLFTNDFKAGYRDDDDLSEYFKDYPKNGDMHSLLGIYKDCDNNNGGLVVDLIREEYGHIYGKYGFTLGIEDVYHTIESPYTQFISIEEWIKRTSCKQIAGDIDFIKWWHAFCKWYELEPVID